MRQDIVNAPIAKVRGADGVAIAARSQRPRQEFIKIRSDTGNLVFIENTNAGHISVAIKSCNLPRRERDWTLCGGRMKPQVSFKLAQVFSAGDEIRCS
jgi:hypothetical protein